MSTAVQWPSPESRRRRGRPPGRRRASAYARRRTPRRGRRSSSRDLPIIQERLERPPISSRSGRPSIDAGVDERAEVVRQPDDERRHAQHEAVDRHRRVHRHQRVGGREQARQIAVGGATEMFGDAGRQRPVDVRRFGRMRLDDQPHPPAGADGRRTGPAAPRRISLNFAASTTSFAVPDTPSSVANRVALRARSRATRPARSSSRALPVTAIAVGGKVSGCLEMLGRVGDRRPASDRAAGNPRRHRSAASSSGSCR